MFIYIVKNNVNEKRYVGKTKISVRHRWNKHIVESFNSKLVGYKFAFHRAIRKYGVNKFTFDKILDYTIDNISEERLNELEMYYINKYRTYTGFKDCCGYNMTLGGDGGYGKNSKQIDVYDKDMKYVTSYYSIEMAARDLNLQPANVSAVVNNRAKSAGDYIFCESGSEPQCFVNNRIRPVDVYDLNHNYITTFQSLTSAAEFVDCSVGAVYDCCQDKSHKCRDFICIYSGSSISDRRPNKVNKSIDVYDSETKQFLRTYKSITSLREDLKLGKHVVQRCLRTNNHLAGDYLLVPHGMNIE